LPSHTQGGSRVREFRSRGSVRGAVGNDRPYREPMYPDEYVRIDQEQTWNSGMRYVRSRANAVYRLRKPVSVTYRTDLGQAETEIGKW
jgi:hypothetical protein